MDLKNVVKVDSENKSLSFYSAKERETIQEMIAASKASATRRVYATQFKQFVAFCDNHKPRALKAFPASPSAVALYIGELVATGKSASTITQSIAAIRAAHELKGLPSPTADPRVKMAVKGARRAVGVGVRKKDAVTPAMLKEMIGALNLKTLKGLRDRAVILLGFSGAFRRSELSALNVDDLKQTLDKKGRRAYLVTVRKSKTDQEGKGMVKAIFTASDKSLDPVKALDEYMRAASVTEGALFRQMLKGNRVKETSISGSAVACIVQSAARDAGILLDISGHSLRSGFVTTSLEKGASERSIMNQTGHRSVMVMRGYQRRVNAMTDNAAASIL